MYEQAFRTLEYTDLRALVRRGAQTVMGRARVEELQPITERAELSRALQAISECVELRRRQGGAWSFTEFSDPASALALLNIEGSTL